MIRNQWIFALGLSLLILLAACQSNEDVTPTSAPQATGTSTSEPVRGVERATEESTGRTPEASSDVDVAPSQAEEIGEVVYQVPFDLQLDGFRFPNYGTGYPEGAFTINDLRAQFGDGVCSRIDVDGEECIPSAAAQVWLDDRNADMQAGHCIGFTVTSYEFFNGDLQAASFADSASAPYDLEQRIPIMRTIAANGSLYWVKSVWSSEVSGTPREIIDDLIELAEPVDLSIYLPGLAGGHSMLAYGVEKVATDAYRILVYDNNFPGEEKYVEVDYAANTWRYAQGAINPNETTVPYEGDATTESLRYIPLTAYESVPCPFCPVEEDGETIPEDLILLSLVGQGDVLVKTALGVIGSVAGNLINEVRGAQFIFHRGQLAGTDTPDISLPEGTDYTVEFSGLERVSSLGQELTVVVDQLVPDSDDNELAINTETNAVEFVSGGTQSPLLNTILREDDVSYSVAILGVEFADGEGLRVAAAEGGEGLELRPEQVDITDGTLLVTRLTADDEAVFASTKLNIQDGAGIALDLANWDGAGGIDVYADSNGDGTYTDPPTDLPNQPLSEVLRASDASEVVAIASTLAPYVGEAGIESMLAALDEDALTGREIGLILQKLDLTNDQLVQVINKLTLDIPELGDLLYALSLEDDRLEDLILALDLDAEDEAELRAYLAELALFNEILISWQFLGSEDMIELAALLADSDLTADQLARLLPLFELSNSDLETLLAELGLPAEDWEFLAEELGVRVISGRANRTPGAVQPSVTVTATPTATTVTGTPTATGTVTATATSTGLVTPSGTPTPDPYPGALPPPTRTPSAYPYPGPLPSPTSRPEPYPGSAAAPTPAFQSLAFCEGDDLRIVAKEPTWKDITVEIWLGDEQLVSGAIGPNGEPFETVLAGPRQWTGLVIKSPVEPFNVKFNAISCPRR